MNLHKLSNLEIQQRIENFKIRTETLNSIIEDIKDSQARLTLESHLKDYNDSVLLLKKELENRLLE